MIHWNHSVTCHPTHLNHRYCMPDNARQLLNDCVVGKPPSTWLFNVCDWQASSSGVICRIFSDKSVHQDFVCRLLSSATFWLRSFSSLDRSRFVRRDRSSPVKKNARIFRSGRGHLLLVYAERRRPRPHLKVNKLRGRPAASQIFLRCVGADLDLI